LEISPFNLHRTDLSHRHRNEGQQKDQHRASEGQDDGHHGQDLLYSFDFASGFVGVCGHGIPLGCGVFAHFIHLLPNA
jgi:hypothetical protein